MRWDSFAPHFAMVSFHVEMDSAVAAAYDWQDLDLGDSSHETATSAEGGIRYTVSEDGRREPLNHERYAEEVRLDLHEKKQRGAGAAGQMSLF